MGATSVAGSNYASASVVITPILLATAKGQTLTLSKETTQNQFKIVTNGRIESSVFLVPTFGGYNVDVHTGKYKTILGSGFIYILGLILLFASSINFKSLYGDQHHYKDSKRAFFYSSLVLITIGSGGIKSNIGPLGAQQVECLGTLAVQSFFSWFYWFINFGAVIANTEVAYVQQNVGHFDYGYLLAVVVMIVGQIIFRIGKNRYTTSQEEGSPLKEIFGICWASKCRGFGQVSNENQGRHNGDVSVNRVRTFCKLLPIFGFVVVYFGIYAQIDSTFFLQSERLDISVLSKKVPVAALRSFDNIAILILIPLMEIFIYPHLKRINRPPSLLQRMGLGMTFAVVSIVAAGILEKYRKEDLSVHQTILNHTYTASSVSVFAQVPQFTLIGASEVFTIVSGMEFTYSEAPDLMKGLCMGLYMETAGLGTYFAVMIISIVKKVTKGVWFSDEINDGKTEYLFFLFAGIMFVNFILFICVAKRYAYSLGQKR